MLYTLFAGINPAKTIPIVLDVGTNNEALLNDPNYLGWRHSRIADKQYDKFIEEFVHTVKKKFPKVFFHWEDFGRDNAAKNLAKYQNFMCSFNDDIQGTGVVTLAAILAALGATRQNINEQRIVIFGAGSAGTGIADQIKSAMIRNGLAENEAIKNFWLLNSKGLVTDKSQNLTPNQKTYLRNSLEISSWQLQSQNKVDLFDVVKNVKPTILIGCSTVKGAFTKEIIIEMAKSTEIPMIFPLSNPNEKSEATPSDLINWTAGKALIATGSPFEPVKFNDKTITVSQCNNALAFPGIGLGVVVTKAKKLTDDMLWEATQSLLKLSPILNKKQNLLLPSIEDAPQAACDIALAVAKQAVKEKVAQLPKGKNIKTIIRNTTDNQAKK
jgi:malate dehydrogenase (oxaloacetate-decarboxylating)